MRNIDGTINYFIEEISHNELMNKKHKKVYIVLNYIKHLLILLSIVIECVSISTFASLAGIPTWITSSAIGLKFCVVTAGVKKYKLIIKKKKKKHDKIALLAKCKLNSIVVNISKAIIDSNISQDKFF